MKEYSLLQSGKAFRTMHNSAFVVVPSYLRNTSSLASLLQGPPLQRKRPHLPPLILFTPATQHVPHTSSSFPLSPRPHPTLHSILSHPLPLVPCVRTFPADTARLLPRADCTTRIGNPSSHPRDTIPFTVATTHVRSPALLQRFNSFPARALVKVVRTPRGAVTSL